ncbi:MAG: L-lactate dehydrogenase complex protein LldG [Cryptosporangiaceae bacterium]|nr:L-lactate dehydrogenase complex protein LldG [Cryptosporangiaceae bacterium]
MTAAREEMLARIRAAVTGDPLVGVPRSYRRAGSLPPGGEECVALLTDRLADYGATIHRAGMGSLADAVLAALASARDVVVPPGLGADVLAACAASGARIATDTPPLSHAELDQVDAVLTESAVAIAVTGTIVLDGSEGQGRRALSLIPDRHVVIVRVSQIVETVPEGLARLDGTRPITLISGPSATSDIELTRVEGVHGPRNLAVVLVG